MAARTTSVAFDGAEAGLVDVQVQVAGGQQPIFSVVGLGDKAVTESRERVRAAFAALGLSLPLLAVEVECVHRIGVTEARWRLWQRQISTIHQFSRNVNGSTKS